MTVHVKSYRLEVDLWRHGASGPDRLSPMDFSTQKSIGSPSGAWSLTLGTNRLPVPWQEIADDDWVTIVLEELHSRTRNLLMFGPVDSVRESVQAAPNGARQATINLSGRDFGKAFEVSELLWDMYLQNASVDVPGIIDTAEMGALVDLLYTNPNVTPAKAAARLLATILTKWWTLPAALGGQYLGDVLHYTSNVELGQVLNVGSYIPSGNAKIDQYLRRIFGTPYHDFWYDMRPATEGALIRGAALDTSTRATHPALAFLRPFGLAPTVVFRNLPSPFGDATGAHVIDGSEELSADLGRSGAERFTMFSSTGPAWAANLTSGTFGASGHLLPIFDNDGATADSIARHGLKYLELADSTAPTSQYGSERRVPIEWVIDRAHQSYMLYSTLAEALSGTSRLAHVRPDIRVGDKAIRDGYRYRVEQVSHSGQVLPSGLTQAQTTVAISKGFKVGRKPPAIPGPWKIGGNS